MGQLFEDQLNKRWGQQIKPSSREFLNVSGNEDDEPVSLEWSQVSRMKVLGQFIQNDGGIDYDVSEASKSAWASFWRNAGVAHARRLPLIIRLNLIDRATLPTLSQRVARWPFTKDKAATLDALQRKMIGVCVRHPVLLDDTPESYMRRKRKIISQLQRQRGSWSALWASRVVSWRDHCERNDNMAWFGHLLKIRTPEELQLRRAVHAGCSATRAESGHIRPRWCEHVSAAERHVVR